MTQEKSPELREAIIKAIEKEFLMVEGITLNFEGGDGREVRWEQLADAVLKVIYSEREARSKEKDKP